MVTIAKKVEQLPASTLDENGYVVISEGGVSKKIKKSEITDKVRTDLTDLIDEKATPNAPIPPGTKTKITYDAHGFVTGGTSATTADINDTTDRRYITDAQRAQIISQATLFDSAGNITLTQPGAGIIAQDDTGHPWKIDVDEDGQVINMSGFVTVKNGKFYLRGNEYNGVGINFYPLAWSDKATITRVLDYAAKLNINEIRFWLFNQLNPSDAAGNFQFLDYPLSTPNMLVGVATPDFEADFSGWTQSAAEFTRVSDGNARTGSYAIKQVSAGGYNNMHTGLITVTPSTNYTVTIWYKKISQSGFGPLLQIVKGSDGTQLYDGGLMEESGDPAINNGYIRKQIRFNSGSESSVSIYVNNFSGTCTYYYDDIWMNVTGTPILSQRESQWVLMDFVANEARKRGIKLTPSLADNTDNYKTKLTYVNWANSIYGAGLSTGYPYVGFFTNSNAKQLFKDNIAYFLNRTNTINGIQYKNDATFKCIELGNELRIDQNDPSGANTLSSYNIATISGPGGWADEMSTYIKVTLAAKQLVTYGSMSHAYEYKDGDSVFNGSYYGVDYRLLAALPHIDYLDFHWYPTQDALQPYLYPLGELDIVSYGQKLLNRPAPVKKTNVGSTTSFACALNAATLAGDQLVVHLVFGTAQGSTPTITDAAGNTYTRTSVSGDNKTHHYSGPQTTGGVSTLNIAWATSSTLTVYVDENSGRENANNGRSRLGLEAQLLDFINAGLVYGKPSTISEHGLSRDLNNRYNYHYPLQPRINAFTALFDFWFANGGGQINLWSASIVGGGSYSINMGERNGEAVTDNSDDTNINRLILNTNEKFHHHSPKSELDLDTRYAESEQSPRAFDGDYQGITMLGTAGEALSFGHLVYLDEFTGLWKKASAVINSSRDRKLGMCVLAATGTGKSIKVLTFGTIRADALFPTFVAGKPIFMTETAGVIDHAKPTTSGAVHRVIGYADTADQMSFQPAGTFAYVS